MFIFKPRALPQQKVDEIETSYEVLRSNILALKTQNWKDKCFSPHLLMVSLMLRLLELGPNCVFWEWLSVITLLTLMEPWAAI